MNNNSSLKEYYIRINKLYENAVNMLTAINQSLSTSSSEVTVTVAKDDDTYTNVRIPSFLYLENKLEQLNSNFEALFNIPKSGEAWFQQSSSSNMYKLQLFKSSSAPVTPRFSTDALYATYTQNTIIKDLVNPKMFVRMNISNLPANIDKVYMKKIVLSNEAMYNALHDANLTTYDEYKAALYNYTAGFDYDEYDSMIQVPIKKDAYRSSFKILEIPTLESGNPWTDNSGLVEKLRYRVKLDTIEYYDSEDSSVTYLLKQGDFITLSNDYAIYKVINVTNTHNMATGDNDFYVVLEEYIGHIALQTTSENSLMEFEIYNDDYSAYSYVDIPLEENPYIVVFIGTVYNNIRSHLSDAILLNLNNIYVRDANGSFIYERESKTPMTYIQYYNKYCKNIGDLIDALTKITYPQLANFTNAQLNELTENEGIQNLVSTTVDTDGILTVKKINGHLVDNVTSDNIKSLHAQKAELNSQLSSLQDNIDQIYTQLTTTDFNQNVSVTQESLRSQLNEYYKERITLQKQVIAVVDNINSLKGVAKGTDDAKYRVRGNAVTDTFEQYLHNMYGTSVDIIGMDIQYKYKSVGSDTTNVTSINSSVFTDWVKQTSYDRQRILKWDSATGQYNVEFVDYGTDVNIIKWTQIDIPIRQGEDVVIRFRYKYNIGQPFIDLYTPWSNELTVAFPTEFEEASEIYDIIAQNDSDAIGARFQNTLINDGYSEHVNNKIIDNSQIFYHMPENIYSGFNTPENSMIPLKDKLQSMSNDINEYKTAINNELNAKYKVYLEWDNNTVELSTATENEIVINETTNGITDTFIKKQMNLIFRNTGDVAIRFYSIFPGNVETPLLLNTDEFIEKYIVNYERVPLLIGTSNIPTENITYQRMGQWVYFRQNNPYSHKSMYFTSPSQDTVDFDSWKASADGESEAKHMSPTLYSLQSIREDYNQGLLGYRDRNISGHGTLIWRWVSFDDVEAKKGTDYFDYSKCDPSFFIYDDAKSYKYILKYEHLSGTKTNSYGELEDVYFSNNVSIDSFMKLTNNKLSKASEIVGAFLIPELTSINQILCNEVNKTQYIQVEVGKSISIPVIFEYYLDGTTKNTITKGLCFDVRPTVMRDPDHYILNVTAKYDYTINNTVTMYTNNG